MILAELHWTNMPASWGVFVLIAVVAAALYGVYAIYRREMASCPPKVRLLLAMLRAGVVLLLVAIYLGPAIVDRQERILRPAIVVARDASQSMNTADRYADPADAAIVAAALGKTESEVQSTRPTRAQIVNELLEGEDNKVLAALGERGRVEIVDFTDSAGLGTDLAAAIRQALAGEPPAAIVLLTDGQHTGQDDPREAAREAKSRGVPLLIVGVGDPSRPRNLKMTSVYVRPQVWRQEPFEIDAVLSADGTDTSDIRAELIEQRLDDSDQPTGSGTVVQTLPLTIPEGGGRLRAPFSHTAAEAGRYIYSVRVETLADEWDEADNQLAGSVVEVLSREQIRVLLVAGAAHWDYQHVQKLLARDKTVALSCWLQALDRERGQEGTRPITRLPATRQELLDYDVILLLDPDPRDVNPPWIELLGQFVGEHGGGLLFQAGPKYTSLLVASPQTAAIAGLLPVQFGDVGALEVASLVATSDRDWPLAVVPANADHAVLRFSANRDETLRYWSLLPGVFWSFPADAARPTAEVLIEHSDPSLRGARGARPLVVAGRYGAGHTLYLGFEGTWRWRRAGRQAELFDKFWIQTVRHLAAGRALAGRRRGYVQSDRERYEIGERVTITARLYDAAYNPLTVPQVEATLQAPGADAQAVPLAAQADLPGGFSAMLVARQTGVHTLRLALPGDEAEAGPIETLFTVELPSVEISQVWLNKPLLLDLASLSGGRYFEVNQLDQLPAAVPDRTTILESRSRPEPIWDVPAILVALVGLLGVEWFFRRRFELL